MKETSVLHKRLLGEAGTRLEAVINIDGTDYGMDRYVSNSLRIVGELFPESTVGAGGTNSRQTTFTVRGSLRHLPRMAKVKPKVRFRGIDGSVGEWIPKGEFFIDTRPYNPVTDTTQVTAYDAMLKMTEDMVPIGSTGTWPRTPTSVMLEIASRIGVQLDSRTVLDDRFLITDPNDDAISGSHYASMRQVAGWIAGMHCGNWIITDDGKLLLVRLNNIGKSRGVLVTQSAKILVFGHSAIITRPILDSSASQAEVYNIHKQARSMDVNITFQPFTRVRYYYGEDDFITVGTNSGRELAIECPFASNRDYRIAMANAALDMVSGRSYQPFSAYDAFVDPAAELGDAIIVNGMQSIIGKVDTICGSMYVSTISAPSDEEIDHEYPIKELTQKDIRKEIESLDARIETISDIVESVFPAINIDAIKDDISGLIDEIEAGILPEAAEELIPEIEAIRDDLDDAETVEDLQDIADKISDFVDTNVDSIDPDATDTINEDIDTAQDEIDAAGRVEDIGAIASDVNTIKEDVNSLQDDVTALSDAVEAVVDGYKHVLLPESEYETLTPDEKTIYFTYKTS